MSGRPDLSVATDTAHACDEYTTVDALAATVDVYVWSPATFADAVRAVPDRTTRPFFVP